MGTYNVGPKILRRMRASGGAVFTPKDFLDLGSRAAVDQALARSTKAGKIRRIGRGLYDAPQKSPLVGVRSPSLDSIAAAVARNSAARIAPTGAQAASMYGLSTQVPAQARYLTDRSPRTLSVGRQTIRLNKVVPQRIAGSKVAQTVIEAFRHLGPNQIGPSDIGRVKELLSKKDRQALRNDFRYAPTWMHTALRSIVDDTPSHS
jgi:hypothetical protein